MAFALHFVFAVLGLKGCSTTLLLWFMLFVWRLDCSLLFTLFV